ncbi:hypothetical protein EHM76_00205 [bacterium]|nr:MAG: hypothetical protein EHM76_00205 [bacterium]
MERQLHLFRSKRQRGVPLLRAKEYELHCMVADTLRRWCNPLWRYTHIPAGEKRDMVTAMRLKRMGVMPGFPDFIFCGPGASVFWLELKRPGGRLSEVQSEVALHLIKCGFTYHCSDDYADIIGTLRDLGIVQARVSA